MRMTPVGPLPGPRRGPHVAAAAIHELGAIDTTPTTAAAPLTATAPAPIVPDLLDDEVVETSQALVTVDIDSSAMVANPPSEPPTSSEAPEDQKEEATPVIAGIGKIERNKAPRQPKPKRERIVVPERSINGGLDFKFETDPYNIDLCGLLTTEDYTDSITLLNDTLRPSRSKTVDTGLLVTGPLIIPLALWGVRHSKQVKKRKLLLVQGIQDFNDAHSTLYMRYNRPGGLNYLSIEPRKEEHSPMLTGAEESWMNHEPIV